MHFRLYSMYQLHTCNPTLLGQIERFLTLCINFMFTETFRNGFRILSCVIGIHKL
jgi:hypothetical protein